MDKIGYNDELRELVMHLRHKEGIGANAIREAIDEFRAYPAQTLTQIDVKHLPAIHSKLRSMCKNPPTCTPEPKNKPRTTPAKQAEAAKLITMDDIHTSAAGYDKLARAFNKAARTLGQPNPHESARFARLRMRRGLPFKSWR